eukprot:6106182-Pyramimonas_sp.AAC.1
MRALAVWIAGRDPADTRPHGHVPRRASEKGRRVSAGSRHGRLAREAMETDLCVAHNKGT